MSAHTPGPWKASFFRSKSHRIDAPGWDELAVVYGNEDDDLDRQGRANARLIAAAPELLAALRAAVDCGMVPTTSASDGGAARYSIQVAAADMIRAAIAKAEGKS